MSPRGRAWIGCMILLALLVMLLSPLASGASPRGPGWMEHETLGWVHDHPDPGAPASLLLFPDHAEVVRRVEAVADDAWFTVHDLGTSVEGRAIRLVEVTDPESDIPLSERVVTFLITQQHGNEPAGTPAALRLLEEIRDGGALRDTLSNQVLLVLPMANPDGAEAARRTNANNVDTNRDHNHLETPEADVMHGVLTRWRVHVALDHHEYSGTGLGNPFPIRLYDYDLTTLYPTHAGVHPNVLLMAKRLMYDAIWPAVESEGYTVNEYGVLTLHGIPLEQLAGGPDPGILRNHWGLHHISGILIESRVDAHDNPFHDAARREEIQYLTMRAALEHVSAHAGLYIAARDTAEAEHAAHPPRRYFETAGGSGAQIPGAYRVMETGAAALLERHGLPPGGAEAAGLVHNLDHAWPVHAAALLSEASSRRVLEGVPTEPVLPAEQAFDTTERAPAVGVVSVAVLAAVVALLRGRSANRSP